MGPTKQTKAGFYFCGSRKMIQGSFEPDETRFLQTALPLVEQFINVGANTGYYCCLALASSKPVIAFEPNDLNVKHLLTNVCLNGWQDQIEVYPMALGANPGIAELFGAGTGGSFLKGWANNPDWHVSLTPVSSLDHLLNENQLSCQNLVLIDVEGAEHLVLEGASRLIHATPKPIWLVEISIMSHRPGETVVNPNLRHIFELFWNANYDSWLVEESPRSIDENDIKMIENSNQNPFSGNNFIFAERGRTPQNNWKSADS